VGVRPSRPCEGGDTGRLSRRVQPFCPGSGRTVRVQREETASITASALSGPGLPSKGARRMPIDPPTTCGLGCTEMIQKLGLLVAIGMVTLQAGLIPAQAEPPSPGESSSQTPRRRARTPSRSSASMPPKAPPARAAAARNTQSGTPSRPATVAPTRFLSNSSSTASRSPARRCSRAGPTHSRRPRSTAQWSSTSSPATLPKSASRSRRPLRKPAGGAARQRCR
jgi:hypothetical protein